MTTNNNNNNNNNNEKRLFKISDEKYNKLDDLDKDIINMCMYYSDDYFNNMIKKFENIEKDIAEMKDLLYKELLSNAFYNVKYSEKEIEDIINDKEKMQLEIQKMNGYIDFRKEIYNKVREENPDMGPFDVTKEIAMRWRYLDEEIKEKYYK